MQGISLEPAAKKVSEENSKCPLIFELPPKEGRQKLEDAQNSPVFLYPAEIKKIQMDTCSRRTNGSLGTIPVYVVIPSDIPPVPAIIFYIHGAGWVFGSFHTHEKLVRELAYRTNSIAVFPEYSRSPEAKYPTALEQCYAVLLSLSAIMAKLSLQPNMQTLTVAGDSVGGNMATVMTILSKYRQGPYINKQLLYYPVTNAYFGTCSYIRFATDYYLYRKGMIWFWNQYLPCIDTRKEITASPLCATTEQLCGLPDAMILNGEADVLRDEGQAYANKLRLAGVDVTAICYQGIIHDFVMLHALDNTNACRAAMNSSTDWINQKNTDLF